MQFQKTTGWSFRQARIHSRSISSKLFRSRASALSPTRSSFSALRIFTTVRAGFHEKSAQPNDPLCLGFRDANRLRFSFFYPFTEFQLENDDDKIRAAREDGYDPVKNALWLRCGWNLCVCLCFSDGYSGPERGYNGNCCNIQIVFCNRTSGAGEGN